MSHLRNLLWLADSDGRWLGHKDGGALAMKVYGHLRDHHSVAMAQKVSFSHQTPAEHPPKEQTPSATPAPPKA